MLQSAYPPRTGNILAPHSRIRAGVRLLTTIAAVLAAVAAPVASLRAQTCNTQQCMIDMTPTIYLNNNMWGNPSGEFGTGSVTKNSATSWSTSWNFTDTSYYNVLTYANANLGWFYGYRDTGTGLPFMLANNNPVNSTTAFNITGTWQGDVAYDAWCDKTQNPSGNPDNEIMIWEKCGGVGPSLPIVANPTIDGVSWDVYQGNVGWQYTAFLKHGGGNSYDLGGLTINFMDFMNWMISQNMIQGTEYLISVPFGTEVDTTPAFPTVNGTLNVTNYTCSVGSAPPPTTPAAPTNCQTVGNNGSVSVGWNQSMGATSYGVLRSAVSGSGYASIATGLTTTSYLDTGLTNGTNYYYVATATNAAGTSGYSNQGTGTPLADVMQYDFENGSMGWTQSGYPIVSVAQSNAQHNTGSNSLAVNLNYNGGGLGNAYVLNPSVTQGKVVTFHIWIPAGASQLSSLQPYVEDHNWTWTGTYVPIANLTQGAWNTIQVTVPMSAVMPMNELGVSIQTNAAWTSTLYVDSISWAAPPATIPAAPTGLTASSGAGQINLSWTASSGATGYNVKRSTVGGSGYATIASPSGTTYSDTGLLAGATYYYVVSAFNSAGESGNSSQASAAASAANLPIQINSGGPGVAPFVGDFNYSGGNSATNWTGTIDTSAVSNPAPQAVYQSERWGQNVYTFGGLTPNVNYTVRLHFCENYNTSSGKRVFNVSINGTQVLTNFDIYATTGAAHKAYIFQGNYAANSNGQIVINYIPVTDNPLSNGLEIISTGSPPAAPSGLSATAGNAQVGLSWSASSGATSYNVLRSTVSGSGYASVATGVGTTSYTNTGLTNGTTYYFVVTATNGYGTSGNSNQASATPAGSGTTSINDNTTGTGQNQFNYTGSWSYGSEGGAYQSDNHWTSTGNDYYTIAFNGTGFNMYTKLAPNNGILAVSVDGGSETNVDTYAASISEQVLAYSSPALASGSHTLKVRSTGTKNANSSFNYIEADRVDILSGGGSAPAAPTGLTATPGNAQVALSWSASTGATSYNVKRSTVNGSGYVTVSSPTSTSYTNTGLTNGTTYYYVVTAVNSSGESGNSNQASATPSGGGGSLPSPWVDADIGGPSPAGSATYSSPTFTVNGGGTDIWGTSDQFNFVYQTLSGDGTVIARVTGVTNTNSWAKGGVMVRESLAATSNFTDMVVTPGNGVSFQYRNSSNPSCGYATGSGAATYWVKAVRTGGNVSGYAAPDNSGSPGTWTQIGSAQPIATGTAYVGLCVTSHNNGTSCQATFDNVSVTSSGGGGGVTQANLSSAFNIAGIFNDGATFSGGMDGGGTALSGTLLGTSQTWGGYNFTIGPAGSNDAISSTGQTVTLPSGNFSTLKMLATGVNGSQGTQTFTVKYSDGTTSTFNQGISDWAQPQNYTGESQAVTMAYRNTSSGGRQTFNVYLYGYSFAINNAKTVASIILPNTANVKVAAITLVP